MKRARVRVSEEFSWLSEPLRYWTERTERYAERWSTTGEDRDASYWHGERASASVLAAAFAQTDADILAEYGCERVEQGSAPRRGRTDFWCQKAPHDALVIEAKQVWPVQVEGVGSLIEDAHNEAARQLISACADVDSKTRLLTAVFVVPRIRGRDHRADPGQEFLDHFEHETREALAPDLAACAWSFPDSARRLEGVWAENWLFPGVVLVMREATPGR